MVAVNRNGYIYEIGRNEIVADAIAGNKGGYKLGHKTVGFVSQIMFKSNNFFHSKEPKNIGELIYDADKDIITYRKYINQAKHEFHKTETIGLNWDVISNLCPKDKILIIENCNNKKIVRTISVSKALKFQDFKYLKSLGYEKQLFIPKEEFLSKESEEKKRRGRKNAKSNK